MSPEKILLLVRQIAVSSVPLYGVWYLNWTFYTVLNIYLFEILFISISQFFLLKSLPNSNSHKKYLRDRLFFLHDYWFFCVIFFGYASHNTFEEMMINFKTIFFRNPAINIPTLFLIIYFSLEHLFWKDVNTKSVEKLSIPLDSYFYKTQILILLAATIWIGMKFLRIDTLFHLYILCVFLLFFRLGIVCFEND